MMVEPGILTANTTLWVQSCLGNNAGCARSTFGAGPENTCTKPAGQGLQAWWEGLCTLWDLDKVLPGMTRLYPSWEAVGQGRRKSPQCNVAEHGQPSSPELNQDFREMHGIFNAQIRAQTGNAPLSEGSSVLLADHRYCCSFASSFPSCDSVHVQNLVPPRLRTTFHTLSQVKSRG